MGTAPLTAPDRAALRAHLRRTAPLDDADLAALEAGTRIRILPRRAELLSFGAVAVECGTVLAGVLREYFPLADGREVTRGFAGPGDHVGSLSDLLGGRPAVSTTVAEADARVAVVPWRTLRALVAARPGWAAFHARVVERLYLAKAAREYELLALDAEARYLGFRRRYAALEPAIALRHVASYVGITPEHLSRLRRRLGAPARERQPPRRASRLSGPAPA